MDRKRHPLTAGKGMAILASVLLVAGLAIGGTLAYLMDTDAPVENTFLPSKVTTSVAETLEDGVKTDVKLQNTGDIPAYLRAAVAVSWQDDRGNLWGKAPEPGVDYTLDWVLSGWAQGSDGFYYYRTPVAPGGYTDVLFTDCHPLPDRAPEGYHLAVEIIGSGIQSLPSHVVQDCWDCVTGTAADGTLSVKGG